MTIAPANTSVLADFTGGAQAEIAMMIGVGVVKDSDAVFFQYIGDNQTPQALTIPSNGKPLTFLRNVRLSNVEIDNEVGQFKAAKLNLFLESGGGNVVMLTSGLNTMWSQAVMSSLMGLFDSYDLDTPFTLNSWRGTQGLKPCFANIKIAGQRVSNQDMYDKFQDLRSDRDKDGIDRLMRDSVAILQSALGVETVAVEEVVDESAVDELTGEF